MKKWKGLNIKVINMKSLAGKVMSNARSVIGCSGGGGACGSCASSCTTCGNFWW